MKTKSNDIITTQIRLPECIHEYIKQEAAKLGIAQNAMLIILLEQGIKFRDAQLNLVIHQEA